MIIKINHYIDVMMEAFISALLSLILFAIGYGKLKERVDSNRRVSDERYNLVQKELDLLSEEINTSKATLGEIKTSVAEIRISVKYILESINELKDNKRQ